MQYDDKFYDLDDDWICDDDVGINEEGIDNFMNESESQSQIGSSVMKGPDG